MNLLRTLGIGYRISLGILTIGTTSLFSFQTSGFQDGPILCLFRNLTGFPCPFCGTTRSIGSILQGDFGSALGFNPLGFLVMAGAVFMFLTPERLISINQGVASTWWQLSRRGQTSFVLASLTLIWSLNLPRMI